MQMNPDGLAFCCVYLRFLFLNTKYKLAIKNLFKNQGYRVSRSKFWGWSYCYYQFDVNAQLNNKGVTEINQDTHYLVDMEVSTL